MTMAKEEAIERIKAEKVLICGGCVHPPQIGYCENICKLPEAIDMAIEALSKPNYESDTEVRLAVTDRNKDKVVLWDAFGEVEYYPHGEINCVNCLHYHETEDDTGVHSHCGSHGRLIDADALIAKVKPHIDNTCKFLKPKELVQYINELPTVQADRPPGEWIFEETDEYKRTYCSVCGGSAPFVLVSDDYYGRRLHGETRKTKFCPNCGTRMKGEEK